MKKPVSDELLVRYLDGQLDAEQTRELENQLANDPDLALQLDALKINTDEIRHAFDSALPAAPIVDVSTIQVNTPAQAAQPVAVVQNRFTRLLPLAASVVLALGVGLLAGLNADRLFSDGADSAVPQWQQAVVDYQLLYVPDTLPANAPNEDEKRRQLMAVSKASGLSVTDAMTRLPGMDFRRAQTLGLNGSPLVQLAFAGPNGEPFALCFTRVDQPASEPVAQEIDGMNTVSWRNGEYGFILVSFADPAQVDAAASAAVSLF